MVELEDLGDDDMALGPHFEGETCDRFRLISIIRLSDLRCLRLDDLLVLQGTTKTTRKKAQEFYPHVLVDLGDDDFALGPHFYVKSSQIFTSK